MSATRVVETVAAPAGTAATARLEKTVDVTAIHHNLRVLRAAAKGRGIMAVVKGDAYGLGAAAISDVVIGGGADALAVDTVAEGIDLRDHGTRAPILVMDVDVADNAELYAGYRLTATVASVEQVERLGDAAGRLAHPLRVWLRTNVGFNRFGPRDEAGFGRVLDSLAREHRRLHLVGIFAHLSSATFDEAETARQAAEFRARAALTRARFGPDVETSLAATHGLAHPDTLRDTGWVRPGIGLYGLVAPESRRLTGWRDSGLRDLRPAVTVRARVLDVVDVVGGEGLGYDRGVRLAPGSRVASVAIGFSRGLRAVDGFTGVVRGSPCRLVGRPGMDCSNFDVTDVPGVRPGDWLTVIGGPAGGTAKDAQQTATELGLSLYELLATFRMPVRLRDSAARSDDPRQGEDTSNDNQGGHDRDQRSGVGAHTAP